MKKKLAFSLCLSPQFSPPTFTQGENALSPSLLAPLFSSETRDHAVNFALEDRESDCEVRKREKKRRQEKGPTVDRPLFFHASFFVVVQCALAARALARVSSGTLHSRVHGQHSRLLAA